MTQVAQEFQISDRAMAKVCARKQVPVPPRGYWAKKNANKKVTKRLLTEFVPKPAKEKPKETTPAQNAAKKPKTGSVFDERKQAIKKKIKEFRTTLSEGIQFTARIDGWNCDYSFGLNPNFNPLRPDRGTSFWNEYPYNEYRDLVLKGVFTKPKQLIGQKLEARFAVRPHLNKKAVEENLYHYEENPPQSVGALLKQNDYLMGFFSVPEDGFGLLFQNVLAGKIKFMVFRGQKLRYGRSHIHSYSLQEEQDE